MAKGLHGKPPDNSSDSVTNTLLLLALALLIVAIIGMADGMKSFVDILPWRLP